MRKELTCINCPLGCALSAEVEIVDGVPVVTSVSGNTCPRGEAYAKKELTHPTRIITSTVRVHGGTLAAVPVKTASDIPKEKIFEIMKVLQGVDVDAPVNLGQVIVRDVAGTGADIVATRTVGEAR
ncbi:MAG: DUF1667 domain-containing protein [Lachnospiraceae bacterium]|nr:DUF1667 domain-containing protein [Lachnospiraceae bacterium]MBQ9563699.1 DUF1667 domain-containing protein [Lachnospiraceae bacterium]MBQ9592856.1 DUF1667 domain-containing protein [Lachnospiraceae bacterium]MBR0153742.1 DUF1667 domain-containing protein [Lachnospiraceae bacterium]